MLNFLPKSQTRTWGLDDRFFTEHEEINPKIEGNLRKSDCGRITDGGATIFLASEKYAKAYAKKRNIRFENIPHIKGWGHRTAPMLLKEKLDAGKQSPYPFPHLRGTVATGVRMLLDSFKQVTGTAGDYQVEGAKNVATLNVGGSLTTMASFVVGV